MVSCEIVSVGQQTPIIVVYLPPPTIDHLPYIEDEINRLPGRDSIIIGCLKADIGRLQNLQSQQVAYLLASFVLVNIFVHFRNQPGQTGKIFAFKM